MAKLESLKKLRERQQALAALPAPSSGPVDLDGEPLTDTTPSHSTCIDNVETQAMMDGGDAACIPTWALNMPLNNEHPAQPLAQLPAQLPVAAEHPLEASWHD